MSAVVDFRLSADQIPENMVDTSATSEFLAAIVGSVDRADLDVMARSMEAKSQWVSTTLGAASIAVMDEAQILALLRCFFSSRRKARAAIDALGWQQVRDAIRDLLHSGSSLAERMASFEESFAEFDQIAADTGWDLLHLYDPSRYWLWSAWLWNPRTETGALRLVTADEVDLAGSSRMESYSRVGQCLAIVNATTRSMGIVGEGPFCLDVFLACVYGIYMYTVLRMRMSQEFNRIVPPLPSLARRLLGIHQWEVETCP